MVKILRYQSDTGAQYGVLEGDATVRQLVGSPFGDYEVGQAVGSLDSLKLLAPVAPSKVIGVGANYKLHIEEGSGTAPEVPMLFTKPPTAVVGPEEPIVYPTGAETVQYEGELVVVMGKTARHVSEEDALDYVLGYTCGNDVSHREVQLAEMAMGVLLLGKGYDSFCPLGPVIATGLDPSNLMLETRLNGERRQQTSTADLLFSVPHLIAFMTRFFTLLPGDVISTGTPSGVGNVAPGDSVEIEIEGIGVLRNHVVAEE